QPENAAAIEGRLRERNVARRAVGVLIVGFRAVLVARQAARYDGLLGHGHARRACRRMARRALDRAAFLVDRGMIRVLEGEVVRLLVRRLPLDALLLHAVMAAGALRRRRVEACAITGGHALVAP